MSALARQSIFTLTLDSRPSVNDMGRGGQNGLAAIGAFLTFVLAIGDYATPQILGGNRELLLPQVIVIEVQRRGDFPMASAMSMVLMVLASVAFFVSSRQMRMAQV